MPHLASLCGRNIRPRFKCVFLDCIGKFFLYSNLSNHVIWRVVGIFICKNSICVALFTVEEATIQVYLNDEPLFAYQPNVTTSPTTSTTSPTLMNVSKDHNMSYYLKRMKHSCGEVSWLSINEYVSLPPEANLSVRYFSKTLAQAFFSIHKM